MIWVSDERIFVFRSLIVVVAGENLLYILGLMDGGRLLNWRPGKSVKLFIVVLCRVVRSLHLSELWWTNCDFSVEYSTC
jgi:hypothetical protein